MTEESEYMETESTDDEKNILVVDPEDYQKTKKLEAIHKAREQVRQVRSEHPGTATSKDWDGYRCRLAATVADYGNELLPIIEDALDEGVLESEDLETQYATVIEFVASDGRIPEHDNEKLRIAETPESMAIYRQLNRILRKLGLGLELQEDKGPAKI